MYKDKDKQREANRKAMERYRAAEKRRKGITEQGITNSPPSGITDERLTEAECLQSHVEIKPKTTRLPTHKRGKNIKCFADLPLDVQQSIDRMSVFNGEIDRAIKIKRTAIAIRYQHLFPTYSLADTTQQE